MISTMDRTDDAELSLGELYVRLQDVDRAIASLEQVYSLRQRRSASAHSMIAEMAGIAD